MTVSDDESPSLQPIDGIAPAATEAFSVLGSEKRLAILLALWEAYEPFADDNAVPFSELHAHVDITDSGQFNYHLNKLEGQFVEDTEDGYVLHRAGRKIVQTVIAGAGIEDPDFQAVELERECGLCGATVVMEYEDEWIYILCSECEGYFAEVREGLLSAGAFDPAGLLDRSAAEVYVARKLSSQLSYQAAWHGICTACSGRMTGSLRVCEDHDPSGVCDTCGTGNALMAHYRCARCKQHHVAPPTAIALYHPRAVAFAWDHGLHREDGQYTMDTLAAFDELLAQSTEELVAEDPPEVHVQLTYDGDEFGVTFDEDMDVIELVE